jgi:hypothetical protein
LNQKSTVPLGTVGIDMSTADVPLPSSPWPASTSTAPTATAQSELTLFVRDFTIPNPLDPLYTSSCPFKNCSYVVGSDGNSLNATGSVMIYVYAASSNTFVSRTTLSNLGFPVAPYVDPSNINNGYTAGQWEKEDWFGVGLAVAWDDRYQRLVAAVGAPKDGSGLYTFYKQYSSNETSPVNSSASTAGVSLVGNNDGWLAGQFVVNDAYYRRSFFGSKVLLSPDARFLVVADPAGSASSLGRGEVFLYYRRSQTETLVPDYFNSVAKPPLPDFSAYTSDVPPPYSYDKLTSLVMNVDSALNASGTETSYQSDHFGVGMAANQYWTVIGSPISSCVYSYPLPLAVQVTPSQGPSAPTAPGAYTILPEPTGISNNTVQGTPSSSSPGLSSQVWVYGVIAGLCAAAAVAPVVWWAVKRRHKQQLLAKLGGIPPQSLAGDGSQDQLQAAPTNAFNSNDNLGSGDTLRAPSDGPRA